MTKTVIDLFSGTGSATKAFQESPDWQVVEVDNNERDGYDFDPDIEKDIMEVEPEELPDADFIWASPPCTDFSNANQSRTFTDDVMPNRETVPGQVAIVYQALYLIQQVDPNYWILENPRGRLKYLMPFPPAGTITYCQYGYTWQKPTHLWGKIPDSFEFKKCSPGDNCHQAAPNGWDSGGESRHERDPVKRGMVPYELSKAVLEAVENPGTKTRQQKII